MNISFPINFEFTAVTARVIDSDSSSTPSSVSAGKLVDTGNNFTNVTVGDIVLLQDDPATYTSVTVVDSTTELTLAKDIITSTGDYYFVLTAADAFKVIQDGTSYNFSVLVKRGDPIDSGDTSDIIATNSGCRIVSVDSSTQLTTTLPMGGYTYLNALRIGTSAPMNVDNIDFFLYDSDDEAIVANAYYVGSTLQAYPSSTANAAIALMDFEDAIVRAVSHGYRTNAPINTRAFGAVLAYMEDQS